MSADFTMMLAYHTALRRDAAAVARSALLARDDPARIDASHLGWGLLQQFLVIHHTAEDDYLWPRMRAVLGDRPDEIALLDAMEDEHSRIDPLIAAVDAALLDTEHGHERLGDVADEFAHQLGRHLTHEEDEALPLIARELPPEQWEVFTAGQRDRTGPALAATFLPWLLDGAGPGPAGEVLRRLPPGPAERYPAWRRAYDERDPWRTRATTGSG